MLLMLVSILLFSLMDAGLKTLSAHYPPFQVAALRGASSLPLVLAWALSTVGWRPLLRVRWPLHLLRGVLGIAMMAGFVYGLRTMPLSTAYAITFVAPMLVTAMAGPLLGERVGPGRWVAIGVGLIGVLVILRPDAAPVDLAAILAITSGMAYALSMILARLQGQFTAAALAFHGNLVFLALALLLSLIFGRGGWEVAGLHPSLSFLMRPWVTPALPDMALMAACGAIAALGLTLLNQAYRIAPSASLAPFEYSALLWGLLWGWLVWSDWPDAITWVGIAILVGAGLAVLRPERQVQLA